MRIGLMLKLAGFFLALALPALVLVEGAVVWVEYRELRALVDRGALARATAEEAEAIGGAWPAGRRELERALNNWVLRMERPRGGLEGEISYVLMELSATPFRAYLVDAEGALLAAAPPDAPAPQLHASELQRIDAAARIAASDAAELHRVYAAAVRSAEGVRAATLLLDLRVPAPWTRFTGQLSFEWPILMGSLLVFAGVAGLFMSRWVTRRLRRIAAAASRWRRGDFSHYIDDASGDELGELASDLDRMALDLAELVQTRAELARVGERERIARDLHDTVKQHAFALSLRLAAAESLWGAQPEAAQASLRAGRELSEHLQRELGLLLDQWNQPVPEGEYTHELARRIGVWAETRGLAVELDLAAAADIPPPWRDGLRRLIDEAMANVIKHAAATRVQVSLRREADRFELAIVDDGQGMRRGSGGRGLANMQARAAEWPEARFAIGPAEGRGVAVRVSWRLKDEHLDPDRR